MLILGGFLVRADDKLGKNGMDMMAFKESEGCHARVDKAHEHARAGVQGLAGSNPPGL